MFRNGRICLIVLFCLCAGLSVVGCAEEHDHEAQVEQAPALTNIPGFDAKDILTPALAAAFFGQSADLKVDTTTAKPFPTTSCLYGASPENTLQVSIARGVSPDDEKHRGWADAMPDKEPNAWYSSKVVGGNAQIHYQIYEKGIEIHVYTTKPGATVDSLRALAKQLLPKIK